MAFALGAFAVVDIHGWFDMQIGNIGGDTYNWPVDGSNYEGYKCVVTNTSAGTFSADPVNHLSLAAEEPVAINPWENAPVNEATYAYISAVAKVTPFEASDLPDIPENAKTAVIAVSDTDATNFWVAVGTDELVWTDTGIAADLTRSVQIDIIISNGVDAVVTEWIFDRNTESERSFTSTIITVPELHGVSFVGEAELYSCWADVMSVGTPVSFYLEGIAEAVIVTVTTTNGSVIAQSDLGDYVYLNGGKVNLSFTLPEGWVFFDGATEWNSVITNLEARAYVPEFVFGGPDDEWRYEGIANTDIGPKNGWAVSLLLEDGAELVGRFTSSEIDDAVAALRDGCGLMAFYSDEGHVIKIADDGLSMTIDGAEYSRPHYRILDIGSEEAPYPVLVIDEAEATITSFGEDTEDSTMMSVGTIDKTYSMFSYSVIWAGDIGFTVDPNESEAKRGNDEKLELKAPKGDKGKRFYRIRITD